jgi:hypothetical protein
VTVRAGTATEPHDAPVNAWLMRASWPRVSILMAVLICPFFVLLFRLGADESWPAALITGVGVAAVCGPVLGYLTAHQIQKSMAASGPMRENDRVLVERAARRGPVPEDGALREAALRVTEDRLIVLRQKRSGALGFASVLILVTGFFAIARSPWWWIAVAGCTALLVLVVVGPARLQRRADMLRSTDR